MYVPVAAQGIQKSRSKVVTAKRTSNSKAQRPREPESEALREELDRTLNVADACGVE